MIALHWSVSRFKNWRCACWFTVMAYWETSSNVCHRLTGPSQGSAAARHVWNTSTLLKISWMKLLDSWKDLVDILNYSRPCCISLCVWCNMTSNLVRILKGSLWMGQCSADTWRNCDTVSFVTPLFISHRRTTSLHLCATHEAFN